MLAAYPLLFLYANNPGQVPTDSVLPALLVVEAATLAVWVVLGLVLRNWEKAALVVGTGIVLLFSFGYVRDFAAAWMSVETWLAVWACLLITAIVGCLSMKRPLQPVTKVCNAVAIILLVFPLGSILYQQFNSGDLSRMSHAKAPQGNDSAGGATSEGAEYETLAPKIQTRPQDPATLPDIYFVILDAYGRADILQEVYEYDNGPFIEALRERGFYVADRATANYTQTGLSIGSCFNLEYLDFLHDTISKLETSREPLGPLIEQSVLINTLREQGYVIKAFDSDTPEMEFFSADERFQTGSSIDPFHNALKNMTPWPEAIKLTSSRGVADTHRDGLQFVFDNLGGVARLPESPKFVFAHILAPHPPFVFNKTGQSVEAQGTFSHNDGDWLIGPENMSRKEYRRDYVEQLQYVNDRMLRAVDQILSESERPPIIFLIGDHGPRSGLYWEDAESTNVQECMSILFACHLPDHVGEEDFYPNMSLVNAYRVVFNHYFGADLDRLPDKNYFSTALYPYRFQEVTKRVLSGRRYGGQK
jgi:hypothetical protein